MLSTQLFYGKRSVVVVPADPAISDDEGSDEEDNDVADPDFIPPVHNVDTPCSNDMVPSAKRKCFSPQVIKHITYQTNLYATQKDVNTTFTTTEDKMRNFVAILLYMGISELPSIDDYWAMETRVPQVANL
ncbi:piggyBac transposable element-derived 3-like protein [Labeo rohita]|uniref:PiggyBac transposable element-derived 3-like protein n=1 Tax=Labeo rohita TaxID=84645 RepID=A0A498MBS5_LABRO|nr:piggyBac transposable element-derived 3-like protein [Labeo rohita]